MNKIGALLEKYFAAVLAVMAAGSVIMYLTLSGAKEIWYDEAYTMAMMRHGFGDICRISAADVHPPLYYILLKLFMAVFGESMAAARCFSVIPYTVIILTGGIQLKRLFNARTAAAFVLLFVMFPYMLSYAVEIRMYSLAAMFVFLTALYSYRCFEKNGISDWVILTLSGVGAAYTHYFAMVSAGIIYAILLGACILKKRECIKRWALSAVAVIIIYLPWMRCFAQQLIYKVNNEYWIAPLTAKTILGYAYSIFSAAGLPSFFVFSFAAYFALFICVLRKKNRRITVLTLACIAVPLGTIAVGVIASLLVRPVFVIRYVIPALPVFIVFAAVAMSEIKSEAVISVFLTIALMSGMSNYAFVLSRKYSEIKNQLDAEFAERYSGCGCYIVNASKNAEEQLSAVLGYYERDKTIYKETAKGDDNPYANHEYIGDFDAEKYDSVVLITDCGAEPSAELAALYDCEYKEQTITRSYKADVYLLTKR